MNYSLFDVVALTEDIPENDLTAGMIGAVVDVYSTPTEAYEVEFCDPKGSTIALRAFLPGQLMPVDRSNL